MKKVIAVEPKENKAQIAVLPVQINAKKNPNILDPLIGVFILLDKNSGYHDYDCLFSLDGIQLHSFICLDDKGDFLQVAIWFVVQSLAINDFDPMYFVFRFAAKIEDSDLLREIGQCWISGAKIIVGVKTWADNIEDQEVKWLRVVEDIYTSENDISSDLKHLLGVQKREDCQIIDI